MHDSHKLEQDLALLLKRAGQRAQRAGALGCGSVLALAFVLSPLGVLNARGGWIFLVVAFFVILAIAGRRATRASTEEFQALYRAERGNPERRDAAVAYLWRRAHPTHRNAKPDKAARDILNALGVTLDPATVVRRDDALATQRLEPEALVAPVEVSAPPPPPRVAEPPRAPAAPPPRPVRPDVHGTPAVTPQTQSPQAPPPTTVPSYSAATPHPTAWRKPDAVPRPVPAAPPPQTATAPAATPPAARSESAPAAAPSASAPAAAPNAGSVSPARTLRCEYCGTVRTLAHGAPLTSCPVCFPQIQLDS